MITIKQLDSVKPEGISMLVEESKRDGFCFLRSLGSEYQFGDNRFQKPGEMLLGAYHGETLIRIGGINQDPYSQNEKTGRIRRFYVSREHRKQGGCLCSKNGSSGSVSVLQAGGIYRRQQI